MAARVWMLRDSTSGMLKLQALAAATATVTLRLVRATMPVFILATTTATIRTLHSAVCTIIRIMLHLHRIYLEIQTKYIKDVCANHISHLVFVVISNIVLHHVHFLAF